MKPKLPKPVGKPLQDTHLKLPVTLSGERFVTAYSPDMGLQVCEMIAQGHTLKAITESKGEDGKHQFVAYSTFQRWVINNPELRKAYLAARELSAFAFEDEALKMARELSTGNVTSAPIVRAYDVAMNQLRWSASKRNPREYGERGALNVTVPIQINTGLDLGEGGIPQTVEENAYRVEAIVKKPTIELLDSDQPGLVVPGRDGVRKTTFMSKKRPDVPGLAEMKRQRAETQRIKDIEHAREEAVEVHRS